MFHLRRNIALWISSLVPALAVTSTALAAPPDASLFTTYNFQTNFSGVYFVVCGQLPESGGCFGSASFGPFGHIGAMLEGNASTSGNVVQRNLYLVDVAGGAAGNAVILYRYRRTDTITSSDDRVTTELTSTVTLPLVGGSHARCFMAGNSGFVWVGTDKSTQAVRLTKGSLKLEGTGAFFSNNPPLSSITADAYGYVTVSFGGGSVAPGNIVFGPNGELQEDGGGTSYMLSTTTGLSTNDIPAYTDAVTTESVPVTH